MPSTYCHTVSWKSRLLPNSTTSFPSRVSSQHLGLVILQCPRGVISFLTTFGKFFHPPHSRASQISINYSLNSTSSVERWTSETPAVRRLDFLPCTQTCWLLQAANSECNSCSLQYLPWIRLPISRSECFDLNWCCICIISPKISLILPVTNYGDAWCKRLKYCVHPILCTL